MNNLIGSYQHTLDAKGRVFLPAKYRESMGTSIYMTRGLENCLYLFSETEWENFSDKIKTLTIGNARNIQRIFLGNAAQSDVDGQGRIAIPQPLRAYAMLDKDVTVVGVSSRVEIWDTARWNSFNDEIDNEKLAEAFSLLGI